MDLKATVSSASASIAGFCVSVWSFVAQVFLFLPRLIHDLAVRPDDDDDQAGGHLLVWEFGQAYRHLPSLLKSLAFKTRNLDDQLRESMLKGNLRRSFTQFDLFMVGIGLVVGSGVFYKGGIVQGTLTGSGVFLGYLLDFVPIFLTALIFAEFTVEYPVAGGAFTWTMSTLGEFPALMTLGFLTVNYILTIAAVARVLTSSFALLFNTTMSNFVIDIGGTELDFFSFAIILFLTLVLCLGTRESGLMLAAANITSLIFILFVGIAGFTKAETSIFDQDWLPYGSSGLFQSLPVLIFSYIGFDAIAYSIEEAKDVTDAPPAYIWTCVTAMLLYVFMALSLSFMVTSMQLSLCTNTLSEVLPCSQENSVKAYNQAFVFAFDLWGMHWMQYIFAIGSVVCIVTTLLVALFVSARLIMVGAREWMLPPVLATVSTRTKTPIASQVLVGVISSILALFTGYGKLSDLASFAYLCTMLLVCNAYLGRRYYPDVKLRYSQYGTVEATAARFMSVTSTTSKDSEMRRVGSGPIRVNDGVTRGSSGDAIGSRGEKPPSSGKASSQDVSNGTTHGSNAEVRIHGINGSHRENKRASVVLETRIGMTDANSDSSENRKQADDHTGRWTLLNLGMSKRAHRATIWVFLMLINASSICVGVLYRVYPDSLAAVWAMVSWAIVTIMMWMVCPVEYEPKSWKIHRYFLPFIPSVAILGIVFVNCNLAPLNYVYSLVIAGAVALFYVFFSMPLSYIRNHSSARKGDGVRVIDLVYKHGNWISVDQMTTHVAFFDDNQQSGSPGINSLPGSIVDRNRTMSRTLSRMGTMSSLNSLNSIGSLQRTASGLSPKFSGLPGLSGRLSSSDWTESLSAANSWGSMDLYRKATAKLQVPQSKLETITDTSLRTTTTLSTLSSPSMIDHNGSQVTEPPSDTNLGASHDHASDHQASDDHRSA